MKTFITAALLSSALIATGVAFAQDGGPGHCDHKHQHRQAKLLEKLNLSADREEAVKVAMDSFHEKRKAIKEQAREQIKALHEEQKVVFEELLTEEELEVVKAAIEKRGKHKKGRKHFLEDASEQ